MKNYSCHIIIIITIICRHSKIVEHNRWLSEKSISSNMLMTYAKATIEYNNLVTTAKFKQLVQSIPADILRYLINNQFTVSILY